MVCRLINDDCLNVIDEIKGKIADLRDFVIITDPPYPDYHEDLYTQTDISFLDEFDCKQLVFWSAKADWPQQLSYTAIHIWDKKTGAGSEYERIFERNGNKQYKVFRHYLVNSTVAASFTNNIFTGHPSQKPNKLMYDLLSRFTKENDTIFDPFMGSGSTGVLCAMMNRNFIGVEIDKHYFNIASERIASAEKNARIEDEWLNANTKQQKT